MERFVQEGKCLHILKVKRDFFSLTAKTFSWTWAFLNSSPHMLSNAFPTKKKWNKSEGGINFSQFPKYLVGLFNHISTTSIAIPKKYNI